MKKSILLLCIVSHLFSTVGFCINVHQCGSHKSYNVFGFSLSETCLCDHQSNDHEDTCCKDKKLVVKAEIKDKILIKSVYPKPSFIVNFIPAKLWIYRNSNLNFRHCTFVENDFPPSHPPPLFKLYRVFRI